MSTEIQTHPPPQHKRKSRSKSSKMKKKPRQFSGTNGDNNKKVKIDKRMKQLFRKRARNYNSDNSEDDEEDEDAIEESAIEEDEEIPANNNNEEDLLEGNYSEEEDVAGSDDEEDAVQSGITKFSDGCRAFKMAFTKITSKILPADDLLGPVLSGHKKLIAEKLAEQVSERTVKGDKKKEKHLVAEKGHVVPEKFLNAHEKFLISVATKGVVKLFNAVNKAQNAQKGLNPASFKDAKALGKRKKAAFYSELRKKSSDAPSKGSNEEPGWAPLRDSYMLTNSKLKDWDKKPQDQSVDDDMGGHDSSSDED